MDERRMESMGDTAARASSAMQNRLNRVSERAQDYVSDAGDQLSQIQGSMGPYLEQARRFVQDRPLRPPGDDGLRHALDPDSSPPAAAAILAGQRLERVDLVRACVLPEAEEDHPLRALRHAGDSDKKGGVLRPGSDLAFMHWASPMWQRKI